MAENGLVRRHRLARQHLRSDQRHRRDDQRRGHAIIATGSRIYEFPSRTERLTREDRSKRLSALLDKIAAEKTECATRIENCPFPKNSPQKEQLRQDLEQTDVTADDAAESLTVLLARVRECRATANAFGFESAPDHSWAGGLELRTVSGRAEFMGGFRQRRPGDEMTQVMLSASLLLVELQLQRLIELSDDWQNA
jgi:hypothetical protein